MQRSYRTLLLIFFATLSFGAHAALGGKVDSVSTANPGIARKQLSVTPGNGYTVYQSVSDSGLTVRQYSAQDIVFAVTWAGPSMPDLQELLGSYFPQFKSAIKERRARGVRGPVMLNQSDLVVESAGRMGDFHGRAYAPALLPAQVVVDEIQ